MASRRKRNSSRFVCLCKGGWGLVDFRRGQRRGVEGFFEGWRTWGLPSLHPGCTGRMTPPWTTVLPPVPRFAGTRTRPPRRGKTSDGTGRAVSSAGRRLGGYHKDKWGEDVQDKPAILRPLPPPTHPPPVSPPVLVSSGKKELLGFKDPFLLVPGRAPPRIT